MALVHCPECGTEVSDATRTCPKCGYPLKPQATPNAQPEPTYVKPQPVYVQPQPMYVQPQPYYAPNTNAGSMGLGFALGFFLSWVGALIAYLTHASLTKKALSEDSLLKSSRRHRQHNLLCSHLYVRLLNLAHFIYKNNRATYLISFFCYSNESILNRNFKDFFSYLYQ